MQVIPFGDDHPPRAALTFKPVLIWTNALNMRHLTFISVAMLLSVSCQKNELVAPASSAPIKQKYQGIKYRTYIWSEQTNFAACVYPAGNCLPEVVITRLHSPAMNNVFIAVRSRVQADIVSAFITHRSMLENYMYGNDVNDVITGSLLASAAKGEHGEQFMVLKDANGTTISAYPMFEEQ